MRPRTVKATRYVTPLREGGSLPAIVEADDDGLYVLKFRGAGQGPKALIAELVAGELARALGLPVPEIVFVELEAELARTEPDPEIQDLIRASAGLNLALDYLPGSVTFDPAAETVEAGLASSVVWFDAFTTNVDRTPRNTNMLMWHRKLWLIDHGAALYFHHNWDNYLARSRAPFEKIREHVLLPWASAIEEADARLAALAAEGLIREVLDFVPDGWLAAESRFASAAEHRAAYADYLLSRLAAPRAFAREAADARALSV
ncbi:MAG TPA: HipA family kinase [Pyrinomonadaceae bacterium]